jgi:hypothetical protein
VAELNQDITWIFIFGCIKDYNCDRQLIIEGSCEDLIKLGDSIKVDVLRFNFWLIDAGRK